MLMSSCSYNSKIFFFWSQQLIFMWSKICIEVTSFIQQIVIVLEKKDMLVCGRLIAVQKPNDYGKLKLKLLQLVSIQDREAFKSFKQIYFGLRTEVQFARKQRSPCMLMLFRRKDTSTNQMLEVGGCTYFFISNSFKCFL